MKFTCINIQGNLISEEVLTKIRDGKAAFQSPKDFGLDTAAHLRDEIDYAWSRIKLDWKHFSEKNKNLPVNDPYGTTISRKWMEQFFDSLGYEHVKHRSNLKATNNQEYSISHSAINCNSLPISIVGFYDPTHPEKSTLDIKSSGGTSRLSPHATVQEYLNVTENILYGFATNGFTLRLIRDSGRLVKLTYIEFDLSRLLDEDKYSEFTILYRLLHFSRLATEKSDFLQSILESYYQDSIDSGNRIRNGLSNAVKMSLLSLGKGFLQNPNNELLREKLSNNKLTSKQYYDQLRRLIYRLLFLMVTEERDLIYDSNDKNKDLLKSRSIYLKFYSISRLRKLSQLRYLHDAQFHDLWQGLLNTFLLFEEGSTGHKLGIKPLGNELFSKSALKDIESCYINNELLLECIRNLNEFHDKDSGVLVPINYRALDVEELGSVYEGLLDLHPVIENIDSFIYLNIEFSFLEGTDRKTTGSYYTRPDLVNELLKSALIPVIEERIKDAGNKKEDKLSALLKLKVCDPAAGSGHMMLAAARTIALFLAKIDSGEDNPAPSIFKHWLREAIQHCIYAVDLNPDAVELCKLALWLEAHNSGMPLSFLDHKIRNGNSLVGVTDLSVLTKGIPDEAFNPVTGDDRKVCLELKKENSKFNKTKQGTLDFDQNDAPDTKQFSSSYYELENIKQDDIDSVNKAKKKFNELRKNRQWYTDWTACNLWTSAFFFDYSEETKQSAPTSERLDKYLGNHSAAYGPMVGKANALSVENKFFHWPLEFPDVYQHGGFDVIIGNPPWEIIELNSKEYFRAKNYAIYSATSDKLRKLLIEELNIVNNDLYKSYYSTKHGFESQRKFIQSSNRFPNGSKGRIDLYPLFVENSILLIGRKGIVSLIVPSDIATGAYNADLFSSIVKAKRLKCFFDFENSKEIFPGIHRSKRFCVMAITGSESNNLTIDFFYFGHELQDLLDKRRRIKLSFEDLELFSPNTLAPPILQSNFDYVLAKAKYIEFGVFINKNKKLNLWAASINRMLSLSDSGVEFSKNIDLDPVTKSNLSRMYSGKNIFQFNHRYATFYDGEIEVVTLEEMQDPAFQIETEYYIPFSELDSRLHQKTNFQWLIGYRDVTNATNERTTIACILPRVACDTNCRNIYFSGNAVMGGCLVCNLNSLPFDYFAKQKIMGLHLNAGTLEQLPVLPPTIFTNEWKLLLVPLMIELIYNSWDLKIFADDIWIEVDKEIQSAIQFQWQENKIKTGGLDWAPPDWCEIDPNGCPLPPFKWDETRRAVLKAELDAIYAKLYGLTTEELRYILDPHDVYGPDFPGETFRVLKEKEIRLYGEYRTRRLVLEAWERLNNI